jgi:hypothetical protein
MWRRRQVLLQVDVAHPERLLGLVARSLEHVAQLASVAGHAHPLAAAARGGLEDHREPDLLGERHRLVAGG